MAQKKFDVISAGQTNLFDLFGLNTPAAAAVVVNPPPPAPAEPVKATGPVLPDGWTEEDVRFLLNALEEGPILVADTNLGIPTIHSDFGAEVEHRGFGLMEVKGGGYGLSFDAGGAMQRTPSGKGWTRLYIEARMPMKPAQCMRSFWRTYLTLQPPLFPRVLPQRHRSKNRFRNFDAAWDNSPAPRNGPVIPPSVRTSSC